MILPKQKDGFFPEREDLPLWEVTAQTGLWYGLLKSLTSHIYFYLDDSELWKQYHSVSQEMMEQICNLEAVKPQEIQSRFV